MCLYFYVYHILFALLSMYACDLFDIYHVLVSSLLIMSSSFPLCVMLGSVFLL